MGFSNLGWGGFAGGEQLLLKTSVWCVIMLKLQCRTDQCRSDNAGLTNARLTNARLTNAGVPDVGVTYADMANAALTNTGPTWRLDWAPAVDERACQCVSRIAVCLECPSSGADTCCAAAVHGARGLMPSPMVHLGSIPKRFACFACCERLMYIFVHRHLFAQTRF